MTIEKIMANDLPVVAVFSANWCGPCKMFMPVYDEVRKDISDRYDFFKIDVDECEQLCNQLDISTVPAVIVFKRGTEVQRRVGAFPNADVFRRWIIGDSGE